MVTNRGWTVTKFAVTDCGELVVTVHVPVPAHEAELQPANADPDAGVAVRVTVVPLLKFAEQTEPQSIPAGELVIVPEPPPESVMVQV